jgi:hypothetical protein
MQRNLKLLFRFTSRAYRRELGRAWSPKDVCAIRAALPQCLIRQFPTTVGELTAGEYIARVQLCRSRLHGPIFDPLARHTLARRFAEKSYPTGMPTRVGPGSDCAGAFSMDLLLHGAGDGCAILCGQGGHCIPGLGKPLGLSCSAGQQVGGEPDNSKLRFQISAPWLRLNDEGSQ